MEPMAPRTHRTAETRICCKVVAADVSTVENGLPPPMPLALLLVALVDELAVVDVTKSSIVPVYDVGVPVSITRVPSSEEDVVADESLVMRVVDLAVEICPVDVVSSLVIWTVSALDKAPAT